MSKNDITGDDLKSKPTTDSYRNNFDIIFNGHGASDISVKADEMLNSLCGVVMLTKKIEQSSKLVEAQSYIGSCLIMLHSMPSRNSVQDGIYRNLLTYMRENCAEFFETFKL